MLLRAFASLYRKVSLEMRQADARGALHGTRKHRRVLVVPMPCVGSWLQERNVIVNPRYHRSTHFARSYRWTRLASDQQRDGEHVKCSGDHRCQRSMSHINAEALGVPRIVIAGRCSSNEHVLSDGRAAERHLVVLRAG